MRLANLLGRAVLVFGHGGIETAIDVETASAGRFSADPRAVFDDWERFIAWGSTVEPGGVPFARRDLGAPIPRPRQVFAIGVNYTEHANEAGYPPGTLPTVFTKFPTSLTGPDAEVELPPGHVDWEVELVAAIGRRAWRVDRKDAMTFVAGFTVGQDLSERIAQLEGSRPQFGLAKSHVGFGPTGPWLVTLDELPEPLDLGIRCSLSGEPMQDSRTSRMIYAVPDLIERLSAVCPLLPGDIIFSGTPSGVGHTRVPPRFIRPGDTLHSEIDGIGHLDTRFRAA